MEPKLKEKFISALKISDLEAARYPYCAADFKDFNFVLDACWGERIFLKNNFLLNSI